MRVFILIIICWTERARSPFLHPTPRVLASISVARMGLSVRRFQAVLRFHSLASGMGIRTSLETSIPAAAPSIRPIGHAGLDAEMINPDGLIASKRLVGAKGNSIRRYEVLKQERF